MKRILFNIGLIYFCVTIVISDKNVQRIDLNAKRLDQIWKVSGTHEGNDISIFGTVPGGIYSDIQSEGDIFQSDIYYGYNDLETRWVGRSNWTYSRNFQITEEVLSKSRIVLVCNGLDTVSNIYVNNIKVGSSENMFVRYVFDIKSTLKVGLNELRIEFFNPVEYADDLWHSSEYDILPECVPPEFQGECHVNMIRKMQASFSWDWGPSYPSSGIWKDIFIEYFDGASIRDVMIFMKSSQKIPDETENTIWTVTGQVCLDIEQLQEGSALDIQATTNHGVLSSKVDLSGKIDDCTSISVNVPGNQVKLWWPNGYGAQPLYDLNFVVTSEPSGDKSERKLRIGYRTIDFIEEPIDQEIPEKGMTFYFNVNGFQIYAKGTNSIPIHVLPEQATPQMITWIFDSAKEAHFNMIRVWGGGIYEPDLFYDLADEYGILIWQDFMFAVNLYPTTPQFLSNVRKEVEHQVKRLQYRTSLCIWATNNENEAAMRGNWFGSDVNFELYAKDYVKLYIDTILEYVKELDPSRACLPSSPTNGKGSEAEGWIAQNPYSTVFGDVHYYNYLEDGWDYKHLLKTRFASEYGYQSWPNKYTLKSYTSSEDWSWFSNMMYHRQRHPGGQEEIHDQIAMHLPLPTFPNSSEAFDAMLYLAEITQSMSVKHQTEFYLRLKGQMYENGEGQNSGALYWQANDIWPGCSWASIEINGRWKMLHYYAKKFFHPTISSAFLTENGDISVHIITDLLKPFNENLRLRLFKLDSMIPLWDRKIKTSVPAQGAMEVAIVSSNEIEECHNSISPCFLYMSAVGTPDNFLFIQYPNDASYILQAQLQVANISVDSTNKIFTINLETNEITPFVFLSLKTNDNLYGWFSDNGFIMVEKQYTVSYTSKFPMKLEYFTENLEVISLHDAIV